MKLERVIKRIKSKDKTAMAYLYNSFKDDLYYLALKYSSNTDDAEDILQDSFVAIFKDIKKYKSTGSFEGWMKRITINKAISKYKSQQNLHILINEEKIAEENDSTDFKLDLEVSELMEMIQTLPDQYRLVFNLYELDDYSHKQISQLLSISEGTSKSNLHRARQFLRDKIKTRIGENIKKHRYGK